MARSNQPHRKAIRVEAANTRTAANANRTLIERHDTLVANGHGDCLEAHLLMQEATVAAISERIEVTRA